MNTFAIYNSTNATNTLKFYSQEGNVKKYSPQKIIYDGNKEDVIIKLKKIFGDKLLHFTGARKGVSDFIYDTLKSNNIDYLLCFGMGILKKPLITEYENKLINFHPSLLPAFKGLKPVDRAIECGVKFLGNTAHYIVEEIDSGRIIHQSVMPASDFKNYEDVFELQIPLLKLIFKNILGYDISEKEITKEVEGRKFLLN